MKQTLIRSVLKIGAGVLVAKGLTDESTAEVIIAGLTALISILWGVIDRGGKIPPVAPLLLVFGVWCSVFSSGCATTPQGKAYQALSDVKALVAHAETVYGDQCAAGKVSAAQQAEIDDAIRQFHAAFAVAIEFARADYTAPSGPDLDALAVTLVNLIYSLAPP